MSLPFRALIVPGGLALAGCLWWWYTSRKPTSETKDTADSTVELKELQKEDEQCARSIQTRAPVSDKQLQEPLSTQDEPEVVIQDMVDISEPVQSCEEIEQVQDQEPLSTLEEPEEMIQDISKPVQSCEEIEQFQDQEPLSTLEEPEEMIQDISEPAQSCEEIEQFQDQEPLSTLEEPEEMIQDISEPVQSCEEIEQLQDQEPLSTLEEPEEMIQDISEPVQSCEEVEQFQDQEPLSTLEEPEELIQDISEPVQSCEEVEQVQDQEPLSTLEEPEEMIQDMVDISEPVQSCEKVEQVQDQEPLSTLEVQSCEKTVMRQSPKEQWAPTLKPEKPFVLRTKKAKKVKSFGQFVWEKKLPQSLVGRFIGQKGWHIKHLMEESGAMIELIPLKSSSDQIILADGTEKQIATAATMITEWLKQFERDLPSTTCRPVLSWR
ncbi:probable serine/threonine-protein kinase kinX isoform X6 [Astyanax mexicanus]|uniref:probable serine/threonine-protein kinase kinX isoform X6 n=1 Tax=Astyanax mexicanus TaxID=7994 RepID=UPI0020CAC1E1|nr:probable serine/threonine-protein kinase kinX isoform X6 [Astyanax mexicanus]